MDYLSHLLMNASYLTLPLVNIRKLNVLKKKSLGIRLLIHLFPYLLIKQNYYTTRILLING